MYESDKQFYYGAVIFSAMFYVSGLFLDTVVITGSGANEHINIFDFFNSDYNVFGLGMAALFVIFGMGLTYLIVFLYTNTKGSGHIISLLTIFSIIGLTFIAGRLVFGNIDSYNANIGVGFICMSLSIVIMIMAALCHDITFDRVPRKLPKEEPLSQPISAQPTQDINVEKTIVQEPASEPDKEAVNEKIKPTCEGCGSPFEEGMKFCPECGMSTIPKKKQCSKCGYDFNDKQYKFCPDCGEKQD